MGDSSQAPQARLAMGLRVYLHQLCMKPSGPLEGLKAYRSPLIDFWNHLLRALPTSRHEVNLEPIKQQQGTCF